MPDRKVFMWPFAVAGLLAAAATHAEAAEPRSVESAQAFLAEMLGFGKGYVAYSIGNYRQQGDNRPNPDYTEHFATWVVDRIEPAGRCVTRFQVAPNSAQVIAGNDVNSITANPIAFLDVDWGKVSKVDENVYGLMADRPGWAIHFVAGGRNTWIGYDLSVPNMKRVASALAFLKERCVASTDTGF